MEKDQHQATPSEKKQAQPENPQVRAKTLNDSSFIPPRHWIEPEELESSYWSQSDIQE